MTDLPPHAAAGEPGGACAGRREPAFSPIPEGNNCFFALQPAAAAREAIVDLQNGAAAAHGFSRGRIAPPNLHLTLLNLSKAGPVTESVLRSAHAAAAAVAFEPFALRFDRVKSCDHPGPNHPFLLCAETGLEQVEEFRRALGKALRQAGVRTVSGGHPHVTLFWAPQLIAEYAVPPVGWTATEFVLVHSHVGESRHEVIGRWPLAAPAEPELALDPPPAAATRLARPPPARENASTYVELHARSAFSFLRGASLPEHLVAAAMQAELPALALLDRDGVYGAPRFFQSAQENKFAVCPRVGAEITMEDGSVVPLLVASQRGYQNLCQLITETKLVERAPHILEPWLRRPAADPSNSAAGRRDPSPAHTPDPRDRKRPCFATWAELARFSEGLIALTGDEEGPVRRAWRTQGPAAAAAALEQLTAIFGAPSSGTAHASAPGFSPASLDPSTSRLFVEVQRRRIRGEDREIHFLRDLAAAHRLPLLATGGVDYAVPAHRIVADVFTCLREHTTLDAAGRKLEINSQRHVKSAREMHALFADLPEAVENSVRLGERLDFTLKNLGYQFPTYRLAHGESVDQDAYLRAVTYEAARAKVGAEFRSPRWPEQLERELSLIARLKFSGYFLIVWDICQWARAHHILVQGRGSAANSAVCYVLGITAVDPVKNRLLFDRFLNDSRVGKDGNPSWPDIDLDFPSGERRESVIQEVYRRYGRRGAAMTANVITYRGRSIIRETGKVLGFGEDALDRFSGLYANGDFPETLGLQEQLRMAGIAGQHPRAAAMVRLHQHFRGLPRHLGQHSGGMVICQGQLDQVVPLEPATMADRSVCQWDKDDCENLGIVKIDFLGLGMMAVLQETVELCAARGDATIRALSDIPPDDPLTYEKIRAADTVGVFQIESRAQMATLPRFKPRDLYDLAMEVALVRPGPITGKLVHPLIRRRDGVEKTDYIDPSVEHIVKPILERTKGVILFQEQMLQLAINLAKFTGGEAEELRRAMGFTKDPSRLPKSMEKLKSALRREGYNDAVIQKVVTATTNFSAYGFPESHAIGFAMLAYASTWLKVHRPAPFYASLLNNQPMGFYSPATLLQDAKREGRNLKALPICVQHSAWNCTVVDDATIRLGLRYVKGVREATAQRALAARGEKPFASLEDFLRRTDFTAAERRALAAIGALNHFSAHRRAAMWQVEMAWSEAEALFKHYGAADAATTSAAAPAAENSTPLAPMTLGERLGADFAHTGLTTGRHPMALLRDHLTDVWRATDLRQAKDGERVTIAGSVICRQRPGTASGIVFVSLEDETGIANAVVLPPIFEANRLVITQESALRITGPVQKVAGVIHVRADHIAPLHATDLPAQASHDFH